MEVCNHAEQVDDLTRETSSANASLVELLGPCRGALSTKYSIPKRPKRLLFIASP